MFSEKFGEVHLLSNNAGVAVGIFLLEYTLPYWNWVVGVNIWGVIHRIRIFVHILLQQNNECQKINTASISGLLIGEAANGIYSNTT